MDKDSMHTKAAELGFLGGLGESIRAHVDERLKSPFGGAVILAWVMLHWQQILYLLFSEMPIEQRISTVATSVGLWSSLGKSVLLAFVIAVGFYLLSAVFLVVVELYEWLKGFIERKFDGIRWVSPSDYVASKRRYNEQLRSLQELASDNLALLNEEKNARQKATQGMIEAQTLQAETSSSLASLQADHQTLVVERDSRMRERVRSQKQVESLREKHEASIKQVEGIGAEARAMRDKLMAIGVMNHMDVRLAINSLNEKISELKNFQIQTLDRFRKIFDA
jgi:hypothetical protein